MKGDKVHSIKIDCGHLTTITIRKEDRPYMQGLEPKENDKIFCEKCNKERIIINVHTIDLD